MRRLPSLALIVLLTVAFPAAGQAAQTNAPPGASAIDQYLETIPDDTGNGTVGHGGRPPNIDDPSVRRALERVLPPATVRALEKHGKDGAAVAALTAATARPTERSTAATSPRARNEQSALSALAGTLTGTTSGGVGLWLPLLLVGATGILVGTAIGRRRRGRS